MSSEIYTFVYKLKKLSQNIYIDNDVNNLNKELIEINDMYDKLLESKNINNMTKEFILSRFIKLDKIDMYAVPIIKNMSDIIEKKYKDFYCIKNNTYQGFMS